VPAAFPPPAEMYILRMYLNLRSNQSTMKISSIALLSQVLFLASFLAMCVNSPALAQDAASDADKAFVGKVSQGGRYEVEASKLALSKAVAQDVKDLAATEVHDHELVNRELKAISASKGVAIAPTLIAEFQQKLDHLKSLSGAEFDAAYLDEMKAIHDKDEKLFAQEAVDGGAGEYKAFAAKTDRIVKRHIGALNGV
jgi:putative membrane protein